MAGLLLFLPSRLRRGRMDAEHAVGSMEYGGPTEIRLGKLGCVTRLAELLHFTVDERAANAERLSWREFSRTTRTTLLFSHAAIIAGQLSAVNYFRYFLRASIDSRIVACNNHCDGHNQSTDGAT